MAENKKVRIEWWVIGENDRTANHVLAKLNHEPSDEAIESLLKKFPVRRVRVVKYWIQF